ncbi:hypothetical protein QQF64_027057 [Cirrhinus molitorella]|uniref:Uncharacterized protein n=1 Tax=Cirrhinus molitorella TaxID=172907 RepID=A0ABR3NBC1_9TELE
MDAAGVDIISAPLMQSCSTGVRVCAASPSLSLSLSLPFSSLSLSSAAALVSQADRPEKASLRGILLQYCAPLSLFPSLSFLSRANIHCVFFTSISHSHATPLVEFNLHTFPSYMHLLVLYPLWRPICSN